MFLFCLQIALLSFILIVTIHLIWLEFPKLYPQNQKQIVPSPRYHEMVEAIKQEKEKKNKPLGGDPLPKDEYSEENKQLLTQHLRDFHKSLQVIP